MQQWQPDPGAAATHISMHVYVTGEAWVPQQVVHSQTVGAPSPVEF
jgi:hypothetical protein